MYAVLKQGGKQYKVKEGDIIHVEKIGQEKGAKVVINDVLLVYDGKNTFIGTPIVEEYTVQAEVIGDSFGPKVRSLKFKPRQNEKKKIGHRQSYTELEIKKIAKKKGKSKE